MPVLELGALESPGTYKVQVPRLRFCGDTFVTAGLLKRGSWAPKHSLAQISELVVGRGPSVATLRGPAVRCSERLGPWDVAESLPV